MNTPTSGTRNGAAQALPGAHGQALLSPAGSLAGQHIAVAVADAEGFDAEALVRHAQAVQAATRNDEARQRFCSELVTTLNVLALQFAPAEAADAN